MAICDLRMRRVDAVSLYVLATAVACSTISVVVPTPGGAGGAPVLFWSAWPMLATPALAVGLIDPASSFVDSRALRVRATRLSAVAGMIAPGVVVWCVLSPESRPARILWIFLASSGFALIAGAFAPVWAWVPAVLWSTLALMPDVMIDRLPLQAVLGREFGVCVIALGTALFAFSGTRRSDALPA